MYMETRGKVQDPTQPHRTLGQHSLGEGRPGEAHIVLPALAYRVYTGDQSASVYEGVQGVD
jgi:hypothetical protein